MGILFGNVTHLPEWTRAMEPRGHHAMPTKNQWKSFLWPVKNFTDIWDNEEEPDKLSTWHKWWTQHTWSGTSGFIYQGDNVGRSVASKNSSTSNLSSHQYNNSTKGMMPYNTRFLLTPKIMKDMNYHYLIIQGKHWAITNGSPTYGPTGVYGPRINWIQQAYDFRIHKNRMCVHVHDHSKYGKEDGFYGPRPRPGFDPYYLNKHGKDGGGKYSGRTSSDQRTLGQQASI
jgi:hypothetical protein